jgi:hypothetical protein
MFGFFWAIWAKKERARKYPWDSNTPKVDWFDVNWIIKMSSHYLNIFFCELPHYLNICGSKYFAIRLHSTSVWTISLKEKSAQEKEDQLVSSIPWLSCMWNIVVFCYFDKSCDTKETVNGYGIWNPTCTHHSISS